LNILSICYEIFNKINDQKYILHQIPIIFTEILFSFAILHMGLLNFARIYFEITKFKEDTPIFYTKYPEIFNNMLSRAYNQICENIEISYEKLSSYFADPPEIEKMLQIENSLNEYEKCDFHLGRITDNSEPDYKIDIQKTIGLKLGIDQPLNKVKIYKLQTTFNIVIKHRIFKGNLCKYLHKFNSIEECEYFKEKFMGIIKLQLEKKYNKYAEELKNLSNDFLKQI